MRRSSKLLFSLFALMLWSVGARCLARIPGEIASSHFTVTIDGRTTPVMHAAMNLYFLNFQAHRNALITVTSDTDDFWAAGVEVQPWRLNIRPKRNGRTLTFRLRGAQKITISRPGDFGSDAEMLFLFANPPEHHPPVFDTPGIRYYAPGVHYENIDAASGDRIYLAEGAVVYGSLNIWQVSNVTVSGRGVIVYDGPQNPADDDGWMHRKNWHCIVMDQAQNISIEGITCVVRSRTWQVQMKDSHGILFDNVKVIGANAGNANADGMDWLGGGDTIVRDTFIRAADDVFALQTSWDGYGAEAFSHQGEPVNNIQIERGVFSTSISNIVRVGWPQKNFEGGHFSMRDADVLHMGMGGCGIPFALMELWADPNGRGQSSAFSFENIRLEDWYSLTQLMQPVEGVTGVLFRDVNGLENPALVASTIKGSIHDVTFDQSGFSANPVHDAGGLPLSVLQGAAQPAVVDESGITIAIASGLIRPRQSVRFTAVGPGAAIPGIRLHWTFGDGSDATGIDVQHRFQDAGGTLLDGSGRYRVLLEATSPDGRHLHAYQPVIVSNALSPALPSSNLLPGVLYTYQPTDSVQSSPMTGIAHALTLADVPHRKADYSMIFDGYLQAPADGGYTFWMVANEAASLELDGVQLAVGKRPIAQVCGLTGMAAQGLSTYISLQAGSHHLRVTNAHTSGEDDFRLLWQGPGFALQAIPPTSLSHRETAAVSAKAD